MSLGTSLVELKLVYSNAWRIHGDGNKVFLIAFTATVLNDSVEEIELV